MFSERLRRRKRRRRRPKVICILVTSYFFLKKYSYKLNKNDQIGRTINILPIYWSERIRMESERKLIFWDLKRNFDVALSLVLIPFLLRIPHILLFYHIALLMFFQYSSWDKCLSLTSHMEGKVYVHHTFSKLHL